MMMFEREFHQQNLHVKQPSSSELVDIDKVPEQYELISEITLLK